MRRTLLVLIAAAMPAAEIPLPVTPAEWQPKVYNAEPVAATDAALFAIRDGKLVIGPWVAGTSSARYQFARRLPLVEGTVVGCYRTERLYPKQASVRIQFQAGEKALSNRSYPLGVADTCTDFAIPIFRAPMGADSVTLSFGLADKSEGTVEFRNLRVSDRYAPPAFPQSTPEVTRPRRPGKGTTSGYARIARSGSAWWLVAPDGEAYFSFASLTPYPKAASTDLTPERDAYAVIRRLGLNSLAGSHNLQRWIAFNEAQLAAGKPTLAQFRTIETRVDAGYETLRDAAGKNPGTSQAQAAARGGFNHAFPDPFDPAWRQAYREKVRATAAVVRGKPYYAGWFADNEREHRDIHRYVWSPHCATEFRRWLERRYASIAALNGAWKSDFASMDDLMARKPDPVLRRGAMYEDFRLFSREVIRAFNRATLDIIHEEDPGRLVFSNRFMLGEPRDLLDNIDLYRDFDAIAVNIYPANLSPGLDRAERQFLELIHQRTGRPILIGEWSVPALDSGLYDNPARLDWSYPQTVATQTQRARVGSPGTELEFAL